MAKQIKCLKCEENAEHGMHYMFGQHVCSSYFCTPHFNEIRRNSDEFFANELLGVREEDRSDKDGEVQGVQEG